MFKKTDSAFVYSAPIHVEFLSFLVEVNVAVLCDLQLCFLFVLVIFCSRKFVVAFLDLLLGLSICSFFIACCNFLFVVVFCTLEPTGTSVPDTDSSSHQPGRLPALSCPP